MFTSFAVEGVLAVKGVHRVSGHLVRFVETFKVVSRIGCLLSWLLPFLPQNWYLLVFEGF